MNVHLPEGWHFIQASQKRHYFQGGRSLCGRFTAVSPPVADALNGSDVAHFYNCVPCERKLRTGSTRRRRMVRPYTLMNGTFNGLPLRRIIAVKTSEDAPGFTRTTFRVLGGANRKLEERLHLVTKPR